MYYDKIILQIVVYNRIPVMHTRTKYFYVSPAKWWGVFT